MDLVLASYVEQAARWPRMGRHILAQADARTVVVYQAYRPSTGHWAAEHGTFGGPDFSFQRTSNRGWFVEWRRGDCVSRALTNDGCSPKPP